MAIQTVKTGAAVNDGTGDDARTAFTKINQNFTDSANAASRLVGTATGNVMEVGAFGLGAVAGMIKYDEPFQQAPTSELRRCQFYTHNSAGSTYYGSGIMWGNYNTYVVHGIIGSGSSASLYHEFTSGSQNDAGQRNTYLFKLLTEANTSVDGNGFIKAASPIVKLFADKIELNDEAAQQKITFEKLGVGDYLIKGSTGFAQEGWYIETPNDANGNLLVAVVHEQLENGDISVKTYDYMLNRKGRIVADIKTPLDIPENRWIDLRLQELPQDYAQPLSTDETVATNAE